MPQNRRKTSVEWPVAVDDRLRLLADLAAASPATRNTSASEVLAALVCTQSVEPEALQKLVLDYRAVRMEALATETSSPASRLFRRRPGRPRREA